MEQCGKNKSGEKQQDNIQTMGDEGVERLVIGGEKGKRFW